MLGKTRATRHFLGHVDRHDRRDDQLAVRVFQRRAGRGPDVLEDHAIDQPRVLLQIQQPVAINLQTLRAVRSLRQSVVLIRCRGDSMITRGRRRRASCDTCPARAGPDRLRFPAPETCWARRAPASPGRRRARAGLGRPTISPGVWLSCPSQKGHSPSRTARRAIGTRSGGRSARFLAMITQRPTIGSFAQLAHA